MADFRKRTEILRAFGQLREEWREVLDRTVAILEADRARSRRLAAQTVAECLTQMLTHRVEQKLPPGQDPKPHQAQLEDQFRHDLRRIEQRARFRVEELYHHLRLQRRESELHLLDEDLFAERTWLVFGLGRRHLLASGAAGGAATGAWVDAHLGGASLLAGTLLGAGIGAAVGWWTADKLVRVRILNMPVGGKAVSAGPTRNRSFPHVVFNRARYHHFLVARRTHAMQGELAVAGNSQQTMPPLLAEEISTLERLFHRLRRGGDLDPTTAALAEVIAAVFARDDRTEAPEQPGGPAGEARSGSGVINTID